MLGVFTDYDGTLVPPELVYGEGPGEELSDVLKELSKYVKLAIVTTKDCDFIKSRVPYAHGYGCINGVEVIAGGYVAEADDIREGLRDLASSLSGRVYEKYTHSGRLAGVTVDWRDVGSPPAWLEEALAKAESMGLKVVRYRRHPFVDIYASSRDKGDAVRLLKALLGVTYVVYMGDSENDMPAWRLADVKILVRHEYNAHLREGLISIPQGELVNYLREVLQAVKSHAAAGI